MSSEIARQIAHALRDLIKLADIIQAAVRYGRLVHPEHPGSETQSQQIRVSDEVEIAPEVSPIRP